MIDSLSAALEEQHYAGLFTYDSTIANHYPYGRSGFPLKETLRKPMGDARYEYYVHLTNWMWARAAFLPPEAVRDVDTVEKGLSEVTEVLEKRLHAGMDMRIVKFAEDGSVPPKTLKRLEIAKKRVIDSLVDEWKPAAKESLLQRIALPGCAGNNAWHYVPAPGVSDAYLHPFWKRVAEDLDVVRDCEEFYQDASIDYLLSMVDQEVWLHSNQLDSMKKLIADTIVNYSEYTSVEGGAFELFMLADLMCSASGEEVMSILDTSQFRAWKTLQRQFRRDPKHPQRVSVEHGLREDLIKDSTSTAITYELPASNK